MLAAEEAAIDYAQASAISRKIIKFGSYRGNPLLQNYVRTKSVFCH